MGNGVPRSHRVNILTLEHGVRISWVLTLAALHRGRSRRTLGQVVCADDLGKSAVSAAGMQMALLRGVP